MFYLIFIKNFNKILLKIFYYFTKKKKKKIFSYKNNVIRVIQIGSSKTESFDVLYLWQRVYMIKNIKKKTKNYVELNINLLEKIY